MFFDNIQWALPISSGGKHRARVGDRILRQLSHRLFATQLTTGFPGRPDEHGPDKEQSTTRNKSWLGLKNEYVLWKMCLDTCPLPNLLRHVHPTRSEKNNPSHYGGMIAGHMSRTGRT